VETKARYLKWSSIAGVRAAGDRLQEPTSVYSGILTSVLTGLELAERERERERARRGLEFSLKL